MLSPRAPHEHRLIAPTPGPGIGRASPGPRWRRRRPRRNAPARAERRSCSLPLLRYLFTMAGPSRHTRHHAAHPSAARPSSCRSGPTRERGRPCPRMPRNPSPAERMPDRATGVARALRRHRASGVARGRHDPRRPAPRARGMSEEAVAVLRRRAWPSNIRALNDLAEPAIILWEDAGTGAAHILIKSGPVCRYRSRPRPAIRPRRSGLRRTG